MPERKLTYILNRWSEDEAGHFPHVIGLLEALARRGVSVTLVIEKARGVPRFREGNVSVVTLGRGAGPLRFLRLFLVLGGLIRRGYRRTYVRIAAPAAIVAALAHRLHGGQAILWQSGTTLEGDRLEPWSPGKLRRLLTSRLPNALARRLVHRFVTGPAGMLDYYARAAGVDRAKMRLLHNDVDVARFAPPPSREAVKAGFLRGRGFAGDELVLLSVHRLSPVRRSALYFPALLARLGREDLRARVVLLLAGGGPDLGRLRALAEGAGMGGRCLFLGDVPQRGIERLYAAADVFLHPTWCEGFPRVILEAMASGLPIASTDAGGTRELLGPLQQGLVVSRDDPEAFARAVASLALDPGLRGRLAEENLREVLRFDTEKVAAMYEEVLFA